MSSSNLYRWSGLALIVGALLMSVGSAIRLDGLNLANVVQPIFATSWLLAFVGGLFVLLGLPAMYAYQSRQAGKLGLIGFVLTFLGLATVEVGSAVLDGSVRPWLAGNPATQALVAQPLEAQMWAGFTTVFTIGFLMLNLGLIVYGIAMLRARVFPRWAALLIIVGVPAIFILGSLSPLIGAKPEVLIFLGFAWCGVVLWSGKGATVTQPALATA